jgi:RND family efflux transporter MFP subunit
MKMLSAALAAAVAACLVSGCSTAQGTGTKPASPVKAQAATLAAPAAGIRYSAAIEAFAEVPLAFKAAGYVDDLLQRAGADGRMRTAQAGDVVTKGTVLARVREAEYRQRLNQARARLGEAEAGLEKARLDVERARTLFAAESLTRPDLDAAQAAFDTSHARLTASRADVELAAAALRDCELTAPAGGVLLERRVEPGSLVGSGTVGFVLGEVGAVKARFGIPDGMIPSVTPGERLDLIVDALAGTSFQGRVTAIAPAADPQSRVFDVEVTIPNPEGLLRPGMIGTVAVRATGHTTRYASRLLLTVPLTAIVRSKAGTGEYAAFVVEKQRDVDVARIRQVQLGDVIGNGIVVLGGVETGERVIVAGASLLVDGEPVRVMP